MSGGQGSISEKGACSSATWRQAAQKLHIADPSRLAELWHVDGCVYEDSYRCRMQHNVCQHGSVLSADAASSARRGLPPSARMHVDVHMQLHLIALPLHSQGVRDGVLGWADAGAAAVGRAQRYIVRGGAVGAGPGGAPQAGAQQGLGTTAKVRLQGFGVCRGRAVGAGPGGMPQAGGVTSS